jgi:hypothetical protein
MGEAFVTPGSPVVKLDLTRAQRPGCRGGERYWEGLCGAPLAGGRCRHRARPER